MFQNVLSDKEQLIYTLWYEYHQEATPTGINLDKVKERIVSRSTNAPGFKGRFSRNAHIHLSKMLMEYASMEEPEFMRKIYKAMDYDYSPFIENLGKALSTQSTQSFGMSPQGLAIMMLSKKFREDFSTWCELLECKETQREQWASFGMANFAIGEAEAVLKEHLSELF